MNYQTFTLNFSDIPWRTWYPADIFGSERMDFGGSAPVADNYDRHTDYGFYVGDDEKAFRHAQTVVENIAALRARNGSSVRLMSYKRKLYHDTENYLRCMEYMLGGTKEQARWLIQKCADADPSEGIAGQIWEYWSSYGEDGSWRVREKLDFSEIYMACGDKALIEKHNVTLAVKFYALAELDWETDGAWTDAEAEDEWKRRRKQGSSARFCMYHAIQSGKSMASLDVECYSQEADCMGVYGEFIEKYTENAGSFGTLLELANDFYARWKNVSPVLLESCPRSEEARESYRSCFMMALLVRDKSLLATLFFLAEESSEVQKKYRMKASNRVKYTSEEALRPLRGYVRSVRRLDYELFFALARVTGCVERVRHGLLERNGKQEMAYYTSLETLRFMLPERAKEESGHFAVMHMAYMNDPNEGKILQKYVNEGLDPVGEERGRKTVQYPYVFMKCFTSLIDDLPMWEMYGDHARGCCVILDEECLCDEEGQPKVPLYRICYLKKEGSSYRLRKEDNPKVGDFDTIRSNLQELQEKCELVQRDEAAVKRYFMILDRIAYLFKNADYQHEQELRIIYNYNGVSPEFRKTEGDYPKIYIQTDFPIGMKEIILGPKVEKIAEKMPYLQTQIDEMCEQTEMEPPELTLSEIDYR